MTEQQTRLGRDFLEGIVRCPVTRQKLKYADAALLARINQAIAAGTVKNSGGDPLSEPIAGGLVREDQELLYPVEDGVPKLLGDEGIPLSGLTAIGT